MKYSVGVAVGCQSWPMLSLRAGSLSLATPGVAMPDRSPLMSAANTGTPWADTCSASTCSVFVLPVPVAPATSPCRLSIAERDAHLGLGDGLTVDERADLERRRPRRRSRP